MARLDNKISFFMARIRQATQRFWATSMIFILGLVSSAFMLWVYSEATYHVSSHLPLVVETGHLSFSVSQSRLCLEKYLSGDHDMTVRDVEMRFSQTAQLADSILEVVDFCEGEEECPLYRRYCPEMRNLNIILKAFLEIGHRRLQPDAHRDVVAADEEQFDSIYLVLIDRTESLQNVLTEDVMKRKARLEKLLIGVIGLWVALLVLVFLVTKSREGHREKLIEALREAEEKVRVIITSANDMIFFQRPDGSISDRNAAVSQLAGHPDKEFEKNPGLWMEMLHPDDRNMVENLLRQPPYKRDCHELSYRLRISEGDWLWINSKRVVVTDNDGNFTGYNCIDRDVTEQKKNAEELLATTRKLEERVKEQQCLYGVCQVARDITISLDDAMMKILALVEEAFQYPEITRARIMVDNRIFSHEGFKPTQWKLIENIMVAGNMAGTLEVYYLEERPDADEGPFLEEELLLVDSVAAKIGAHISRRYSETEIKRNFQFLNSIMDSLTYPFLVLDANDYTIKTANAASGADLSDGNVITCYELTHGEDKPCSSKSHPCPIEQIKSTGQPVVVEHIHTGQDGVTRYHEVHAYPVFDDGGNVAQVIEYFMDITDRKVTENKLGELAAFPANNPNIVMSINIDGEVLYMNSATADALRRMGLSPKNADQCLPGNIKHIVAQCARSNQGVVNHITELKGRTWTWSFHPVAGQNIIHCYATDITELIKQEKEVRLLSAAVNQSSNMVCITDIQGVVEYVNPFFAQVTGYMLLDIVGKSIAVLKSGEHDQQFYDDMWDTIQSGKSWTGNIRNRRMNGELYWEHKTITPIHGDQGEVVSYLSVSNDITAELATQRKLIEADKLSAIGTLAAGVAHEFKNYLGGIIGNASYAMELLKGKDGMKVVTETLPKIIDMGERANDVAMSLLTYSRSRPEDRQPEDLAKIIRKSVKLVEKEMGIQSIELVTHFEDAPLVEVSASKIQQMLLNLLINSQHAIKSHGVITVALFNHEREIEIRVGDTGIGIPHDILEKIFDPFFSTKGVWGKDEVIGTGIGLSICRNIAREHGGELTVDSIVGMGTTFTLTLPVRPADGEVSPFGRPRSEGLDVMIFSLDKTIISRYYPKACQLNARLLAADNIAYVPEDLAAVTELVVCDSRFTGKLELYRMVDRCRNQEIPYVMVNCGASEYELADFHSHSLANFKELPDFEKIFSLIRAGKSDSPVSRV